METSFIIVSEYLATTPLIMAFDTRESAEQSWNRHMAMHYCGVRTTMYELDKDILGFRVSNEVKSQVHEYA